MKKLSVIILAVCAIAFTACKQQSPQGKQAQTADSTDSVVPSTTAAVVVLLAHPDIKKSKANAALSAAAAEVEGVQVINIYDYPVRPETYRECITNAKAIVYEFPVYWMSAPHLLKQWTDEVFMQFTVDGIIKGKHLMVVATTGSEESAYQHGGRNKYTMEEYLRPYEGQANHAEMVWEKPLVVYGQNVEGAQERLQKGCEEYKKRLEELVKK